ncbi:MAG: hypothetical protein IPJ78_00110 [Gemmatimonadetes bacterium]|nr:hypothetical protein [Gemmatimonadota bacterium]
MHTLHVSAIRFRARAAGAVRAAAVFLVPLLIATGCSDLLGPGPAPQLFVLSSIGGVALDTTENLLVRCMPLMAAEGAEMYFLGDTLLFQASGRGEWRSHQRSRPEDRFQNSDSTRVFYYDFRHEFRYSVVGRQLTLSTREYSSRFTLVEDGALEMDGFCGSMRYARAPRAAP